MNTEFEKLLADIASKNRIVRNTNTQIIDSLIKNKIPNQEYKDFFLVISRLVTEQENLERKLKLLSIKNKFEGKSFNTLGPKDL